MRVMATYFSLDDPLFAVHAQVHLARIEVMLTAQEPHLSQRLLLWPMAENVERA